MCLHAETLLQLLDTYVASILNYGCEVWGSHNAKDVEKLQLEFIKSVLARSTWKHKVCHGVF